MKWALFIFFLIHPSALSFSDFARKQVIIWNVGQGSWATAVLGEKCLHFDLGGEFAPLKKIVETCRDRKNKVFFSHWDMDHISFSRKAKRKLPNLCLEASPGGNGSYRKRRWLRSLKKCSSKEGTKTNQKKNQGELSEIPFFNRRTSTKTLKTPNSSSRIFVIKGVLFPGDSTIQAERTWSTRLSSHNIKWLVAGHHGSKTSTGEQLLEKLPALVGSIVSARKARFGHPHSTVTKRLANKKIPVLLTEDWGNIHLLLDE